MTRADTQNAQVLARLRAGHSITPLDALALFGCMRLAARIYDLREAGNSIITMWDSDGHKHWARYVLEKLSETEAKQ